MTAGGVPSESAPVEAHAPGRVNLIGDHTDYLGGFVLPMAIDRGTTVTGTRGGDQVALTSADDPEPAVMPLRVLDPAALKPPWARYVGGVVAEVGPEEGLTARVRTDLPIGAGLSSSASLEVAVALALGWRGDRVDLARRCRRAEERASGVPCGILDQLTITTAVAGHALQILCSTLDSTPVAIPDDIEVVVIDSGQRRRLAESGYATRRAEAEAALERMGGALPDVTFDALERIDDPVLARRGRHVLSEHHRVPRFAEALERGDPVAAGRLLAESHASLRDDFAVSTPTVDALVARLTSTPGVHGARMTGGGFGGCVVALTAPGTLQEGWTVRPAGPAALRG